MDVEEKNDEPKGSGRVSSSQYYGTDNACLAVSGLQEWMQSAHTDDGIGASLSRWNEGTSITALTRTVSALPYLLTECKRLSELRCHLVALKFTKFLPTFFCYRDTDIFFFIVIRRSY